MIRENLNPGRRDRGHPADAARLADGPRQGGGRDPRGELRRPRLRVADPQDDPVRRGARARACRCSSTIRTAMAAQSYRDLAKEVLDPWHVGKRAACARARSPTSSARPRSRSTPAEAKAPPEPPSAAPRPRTPPSRAAARRAAAPASPPPSRLPAPVARRRRPSRRRARAAASRRRRSACAARSARTSPRTSSTASAAAPTCRPRYGRDEPDADARRRARRRRAGTGSPLIRVVGVGGAGVNAVNRMVEAGVAGVEFIAVNTDLQSLQQSDADVTSTSARALTRGLGAGSDPELGRAAAIEDHDRIKRLLKGSDMVFVAAGAGGGTGTGAAPVVARIAREVGALTVGIVTKPFGFEGTRRARPGRRGHRRARRRGRHADRRPERPPADGARPAHLDGRGLPRRRRRPAPGRPGHLRPGHAARADQPRLRRRAHDHVRRRPGAARHRHGHRRAPRASRPPSRPSPRRCSRPRSRARARSCSRSPAARDLSLWEVNEAAKVVSEAAHPDANIIFGAMVDETLEDQVWVTVVATRYGEPSRRSQPALRGAGGRAARRAPRARGRARAQHGADRHRRQRSSTCPSSSRAARPTAAGVAAVRLAAMTVGGGMVAAGHPADRGGRGARPARGRQRGRRRGRRGARLVGLRAALTGLGRRRLHARRAAPGERRVCSTSSSRRPAPARGPASTRRCVPVEVSFGDADAGLQRRRRLVRRSRAARPGSRRRAARCGTLPLARPRRAGGGARARGRPAQRPAGLHLRDPRRRSCSRRRSRRAEFAPGGRPLREGEPFAQRRARRRDRAARRARAPRRSTRGDIARGDRRARAAPGGGQLGARRPRRLRADRRASRSAPPTAAARCSPTRRRPPAASCSRSRSRCSTRDRRRRRRRRELVGGDGGRPGAAHDASSPRASTSPGFLERFLAANLGSTTHISVLDARRPRVRGHVHERRGLGRRRARAPAST